jgi:hypothetical protein
MFTNAQGEACNPDGLEDECGDSGVLLCFCGGDQCICGYHGETECFGCADCAGEPDPEPDDREATDEETAGAETAWQNHRTKEPR